MDSTRKIGSFMPTTAIIRANNRGDIIISSISIRDRLIKNCVSCGIKRIIVLDPSQGHKVSHIEYADEKSATVDHISQAKDIMISDGEAPLYIEDGFLLHTSLMKDFISSNAVTMKNRPGNKNIFSRSGFDNNDQPSAIPNPTFEPDPFKLFDITQDNLREARSRLFKWLTKDSDGYVSKTLNRPLSTLFSKFFADYPITPIYFTGITALLAALMTYVLLAGGENGILWGCLLYHAASVADGIDGEIARVKFQSSLKGAKLDTTIDMITNILFMGAMSYALWHTYGDHYLTLGIYIVALAITGVSMMTMLLYFGPGGGRFDILATTIRAQYLDRPVLLNIFNFCNYCLKRDAFAFIFAVFAVLGLGRYIPEFLIVGLVVWNLAILLNARSILRLKSAISEI